jgi:hypothetical protein
VQCLEGNAYSRTRYTPSALAKDRTRIRIVDGDVMNDFGAVLFFAIDCFATAVLSHCTCDCHEDRVWVRILPCKDRDGIVKVPVPSLPRMRKVSTGSSMTARMRVCVKFHFRTYAKPGLLRIDCGTMSTSFSGSGRRSPEFREDPKVITLKTNWANSYQIIILIRQITTSLVCQNNRPIQIRPFYLKGVSFPDKRMPCMPKNGPCILFQS